MRDVAKECGLSHALASRLITWKKLSRCTSVSLDRSTPLASVIILSGEIGGGADLEGGAEQVVFLAGSTQAPEERYAIATYRVEFVAVN